MLPNQWMRRCLSVMLLAVLSMPSLGAPMVSIPKASPGALIENNATIVIFTVLVDDPALITNSINLHRLDDNDRVVANLGVMRDDGQGGDTLPGDKIFSTSVSLTGSPNGHIRVRASAAFRGSLRRVFSPVARLDVHESLTVMNIDRDFAGTNMASSVYLQWSDLPPNTARIVVNRAPSALGPWTQVMDIHEVAATPSTGADVVDGTAQDWYYQLLALDSANTVLRSYSILRVPKDSPPCTRSAAALPWNDEFISNAKFSESTAMTTEQIRALLKYYGSVLGGDDLKDDDGVKIDPASLIQQASINNGINPQVLIATIQKESSLIKNSMLWRKPPKDGYLGVKILGCITLRCQIEKGAQTLGNAFSIAKTGGTTIGGWTVGQAHSVDYSSQKVSPINAASAALFNFTPVIGSFWDADINLGTSAFVNIWENGIFTNIAFTLKWRSCTACPQAPEVIISGTGIKVGVQGRPESGTQSIAFHAASAPLPPNNSYNIEFEFRLFTWDSYNAASGPGTGYWDSFSASVNGFEYWNLPHTDPLSPMPPFLFGGTRFGDGLLETSTSGAGARSISGVTGSAGFINFALDTATLPEADQNLPSYGEFVLRKIKPATCLKINENP